MSKPNTVCRVCGKEYFCCSDSRSINSWRAMACSMECFKEYMNRIEKARNPDVQENDAEAAPEMPEMLIKDSAAEKMKVKRKKPADGGAENENIIIED